MDSKLYLAALWRRKWIICATTLLAVVVAFVGTKMISPTYTATATLRIATATGGAVDYLSHDTLYADRLLNTYSKIATSRPVLQELESALQINEAPEVEATVAANTELLELTVQSDDPQLAERAANTLAGILETRINDLTVGDGQGPLMNLATQVTQAEQDLEQVRDQHEVLVTQQPPNAVQLDKVTRMLDLKEKTYATLVEQYERALAVNTLRAGVTTIVDPAVVPHTPTKPKSSINIGLGLLLGLIGGIGLAFLFEHFDSTLYTTAGIQHATGLTIVGNIPVIRRKQLRKPLNMNFIQEDSFRRLRINLFTSNDCVSPHTILVTSAEPNEGKSTIASQLAITIARSHRSTVLVDCDLHVPRLQAMFALADGKGVSDVLTGDAAIDDALYPTPIAGLSVMPSGAAIAQPAALFDTPLVLEMVSQLRQRFDIVIIDSPSLLSVTDAALLAPLVDGVVLVVRRSKTQQGAAQAAVDQLTHLRSTPLGVIVNESETVPHYGYYEGRRKHKQ